MRNKHTTLEVEDLFLGICQFYDDWQEATELVERGARATDIELIYTQNKAIN